ncbi:MAG: bifunctional hydroxymethylpyrimidine kinase/phosphomethylpyrimidine kinase [Deltaproteobacteria bacterium]|nr:bifunctional hydroxymethylpyrimidine kinase/phosphomethylpyrimidine kinase [Deltaproteobacteria bacterium]
MPAPPCVLTVAGSDSGGGAGIQADLKTFTALGGFGLSAITALTAQNTLGVSGIFPVDPEFVAAQFLAVAEDFPIRAGKTGMLFSAPIIDALSPLLARSGFPLVVDPVCVSQSGHRLLEDEALESMRDRIVPLATLVTPNRPEAEALTGEAVADEAGVFRAMARILDMGPQAVLLKGGHFDGPFMTDWFQMRGDRPTAIQHDRVDTVNTHGTGCTLSAAIAAFLARGMTLEEAVRAGITYLHEALLQGFDLGRGQGPVNHLVGLKSAF